MKLIGRETEIRTINKCINSENSAYFWLPSTKGGSGEGFTVIQAMQKPSDDQIETASDWVKRDGMGAAGGFIEFALVAGLGGPAGVGAMIGGVAFGAAWSSLSGVVDNQTIGTSN